MTILTQFSITLSKEIAFIFDFYARNAVISRESNGNLTFPFSISKPRVNKDYHIHDLIRFFGL